MLGIDTDSGSEFLNEELIAYCEQEHLTFTRGRPAVKNDQCHVEQKNGAVVREAVGCARLVGVQAYDQLCEVYQALRLVVNYFQPSLKLQAKVPQGDRVRRVYDAAQTPLQRLLASGVLSEERQRSLSEWVLHLDPLALSEQLDALRHVLLCDAHLPPTVAADGHTWPQLPFSMETSMSPLLPRSEEGPESLGPPRTPSNGEETLYWPHTLHHPFAGSWEETWPPELILGDHSEPYPREPHLPREAVAEAAQPSGQTQPIPAPVHRASSSTSGEHEADHLALTTLEQSLATYVQEMRAAGRTPKTLQWHQTSLSALRRSLQRQFRLTGVCSLSGTSLRTWLTELSIAPSIRTEVTRAVHCLSRNLTLCSSRITLSADYYHFFKQSIPAVLSLVKKIRSIYIPFEGSDSC